MRKRKGKKERDPVVRKEHIRKTSWKIFLYGASQSNWWAPAVMSTGDQSTRSFWALATASTKWNTSVMWECLCVCWCGGVVLTSVGVKNVHFCRVCSWNHKVESQAAMSSLTHCENRDSTRINRRLGGLVFALNVPFKHTEENSPKLNQAGFHYRAADSQTEPPHLAKALLYKCRK